MIATGWARMAFGKIAYAVLQAMLLWLSLRVLGAEVNPAVVLAAFAVERILSMVVITPGATGVVEVGMTGVLVALRVDPTLAANSLSLGESPLTERETEVLLAAARGGSTGEIARRVFLSEGTVRNHLSAAMGKLGAGTRAEAVRIATDQGWLG